MYRRKTVEALLRHHARREDSLLAIVRQQNDRLMYLVGKQYDVTPAELAIPADLVEDEPDVTVDVAQEPDDLGFLAY